MKGKRVRVVMVPDKDDLVELQPSVEDHLMIAKNNLRKEEIVLRFMKHYRVKREEAEKMINSAENAINTISESLSLHDYQVEMVKRIAFMPMIVSPRLKNGFKVVE